MSENIPQKVAISKLASENFSLWLSLVGNVRKCPIDEEKLLVFEAISQKEDLSPQIVLSSSEAAPGLFVDPISGKEILFNASVFPNSPIYFNQTKLGGTLEEMSSGLLAGVWGQFHPEKDYTQVESVYNEVRNCLAGIINRWDLGHGVLFYEIKNEPENLFWVVNQNGFVDLTREINESIACPDKAEGAFGLDFLNWNQISKTHEMGFLRTANVEAELKFSCGVSQNYIGNFDFQFSFSRGAPTLGLGVQVRNLLSTTL